MIFALALVCAGCAIGSRNRQPRPSSVPFAPASAVASPQSASAVAPQVSAASRPDPTPTALVMGPENTTIGFMGASLMNRQPGSFGRFQGQLDLPSDDPADARLSIEINMDSVTTKIPLLTKHLKRPDFFDVEHYPTASFVSSRFEPSAADGSTHMIMGAITIHGVTRNVAVPARFVMSPDHVALDATIDVRQSDFGMAAAARKNR